MQQRNDDMMQVQLALEAESLDMGVERYRHQLENAGEDAMMPGAKLIKAAIVPMAAALKDYCEQKRDKGAAKGLGLVKFLKQFEYEKTSFIVARHIMHCLGDRNTAVSLARGITKTMEACLNFDRVAEEDPNQIILTTAGTAANFTYRYGYSANDGSLIQADLTNCINALTALGYGKTALIWAPNQGAYDSVLCRAAAKAAGIKYVLAIDNSGTGYVHPATRQMHMENVGAIGKDVLPREPFNSLSSLWHG